MAPVVEINELQVKANLAWLDEAVGAVDVAVVLAHGMDILDPTDEVVEHMQCQVASNLGCERLTFAQAGDHRYPPVFANREDF